MTLVSAKRMLKVILRTRRPASSRRRAFSPILSLYAAPFSQNLAHFHAGDVDPNETSPSLDLSDSPPQTASRSSPPFFFFKTNGVYQRTDGQNDSTKTVVELYQQVDFAM